MFNQNKVASLDPRDVMAEASMPPNDMIGKLAGGMGGIAGAEISEARSKLMAQIKANHTNRNQLLEQLAEAKHQYDIACLNAAQAIEQRDVLLKQLHALIERLSPLMSNLTDDPSGNGHH